MNDPRDRAILILTVYFRRLVTAQGYRWTQRNDDHMAELADCLIDAVGDPDAQRDLFAAELDRPYTGQTIRAAK